MMSLDEVDHRVELVAAELADALGEDDDGRLVGAADRRYAVRAVRPVAGWSGDGQRVLPAPLAGPLDGVHGRPGVDPGCVFAVRGVCVGDMRHGGGRIRCEIREGCRRSFPLSRGPSLSRGSRTPLVATHGRRRGRIRCVGGCAASTAAQVWSVSRCSGGATSNTAAIASTCPTRRSAAQVGRFRRTPLRRPCLVRSREC